MENKQVFILCIPKLQLKRFVQYVRIYRIDIVNRNTKKPVETRGFVSTGLKMSQTYTQKCLSYQPNQSQLLPLLTITRANWWALFTFRRNLLLNY